MNHKIIYPDAETLDGGGYGEASGWSLDLYLIPAEESNSGVPTITSHSGLGNIGTPMPAWNCLWTSLGSLGPCVVGGSAIDALRACEDELLELAGAYRGSEWDGSNHRGRWGHPDDEDYYMPEWERFESAWRVAVDLHVKHYWDAVDWLLAGGANDWESICESVGQDPHNADLEKMAAHCEGITDLNLSDAG